MKLNFTHFNQKFCLSLPFVFTALFASAQLVNIPVTGFNNDIVANGVGTSSVVGTTYPAIGMDGAKYTFIDNTFKYTSSSLAPTCYMPVSRNMTSLRTAGLTYTLQNYSAFNSMTIDNDNTTYLTSPFSKTGTLTLSTPLSYSKLYVLYESVMYISPMTVDVTVTFTDASTQVFNGNSCVNWFTATLPAFTNVGRTTPTGVIQCGSTPNLFELQLTLNAANYNKQVQSITFTLPTVYTTGTTPDKVNYFHAMAVGGQVAPLGIEPETEMLHSIQLYPNPANESIILESNLAQGAVFTLYDLTGREVENISVETTIQKISLNQNSNGVYFYKISNEHGILKTGKICIQGHNF